jgi:hypothetical protein
LLDTVERQPMVGLYDIDFALVTAAVLVAESDRDAAVALRKRITPSRDGLGQRLRVNKAL